ncbi:MAG: hypothetical protein HY606_09080, partial [Planctomycetes bacterium]|nr:hypothetical protein [Planctomycetota bacterium]
LVSSLFFLVACGAPEKKEEVKFSKADNTSTEPANSATDVANKVEDIINEISSTQDDKKLADDCYARAGKYFLLNNLKDAEVECLNALRYYPNHAGAKGLLWDIRAYLNKGAETIYGQEMRDALSREIAAREQRVIESQRHFADGVKHYNAGDYEKAEVSFKTMIEVSRYVYPKSPEMEGLIEQANKMLISTESAKKQKEIDERRLAEQLLKEEQSKLAEAKAIELKKVIELLFNQAKLHFEREEYDDCILVCDKILYLNPNTSDIKELKSISQRLKYLKADEVDTIQYIREFKATLRNVEAISTLPERKLQFPSRNRWAEIENRYKRKIEGDESYTSEEDKTVNESLDTLHIAMPEFSSFREFKERLQESVENIQFFIDKSIENAGDELKSPSIKTNLPLRKIIEIVLQGTNYTYHVTKGTVHFMTKDEYVRKVSVLRFHEIQDLLFAPPDFPAPQLQIGEGSKIPEDSEPVFKPWAPDKIQELIKKSFGGEDKWQDGGPQAIQFLETSGILAIRTTPETQKGISEFLSKLRENSGINVHVESRFLLVDDMFLEQVGFDFRDLRQTQLSDELRRVTDNPFVNGLNDLTMTEPPMGIQQTQGGGTVSPLPGIISSTGSGSQHKHMGAIVRSMMVQDYANNLFSTKFMNTAGGGFFQYTLVDSLTIEALVKLVHKTRRGIELTSKSLTLLNTTMGYMLFTNTAAYVKDWNAAGGGLTVLLDPIIGSIRDGLTFEVRPIVSADRKYVTLQVRPTIATLVPRLPTMLRMRIQVDVFEADIDLPLLHSQSLATTVVVPDGGTLAIGGLTTFYDVKAETSVPLLNEIPIFNTLTSSKYKAKSRQQLLVLLRVNIIIPTEEEKKQVG